jgi:hypothetical protein
MVSAQSCVLWGKGSFFLTLKHRKYIVFNNISGKFIWYALPSFRIKFWLLKKFRFQSSSTLISLSFIEIGRSSQFSSTWFIFDNFILKHHALGIVVCCICKTNVSLALSWVSLCHETAESYFADGALSNFYVSSV